MIGLNSVKTLEAAQSTVLLPTNPHVPCSGDGERPRGRRDDPRRGLLLRQALQLRRPEHHRAHPQTHPGDAAGAPDAATRGDVLPAPQDGRLLPHLLQTQSPDLLQKHVPGGLHQLLEGLTATHTVMGFVLRFWVFLVGLNMQHSYRWRFFCATWAGSRIEMWLFLWTLGYDDRTLQKNKLTCEDSSYFLLERIYCAIAPPSDVFSLLCEDLISIRTGFVARCWTDADVIKASQRTGDWKVTARWPVIKRWLFHWAGKNIIYLQIYLHQQLLSAVDHKTVHNENNTVLVEQTLIVICQTFVRKDL